MQSSSSIPHISRKAWTLTFVQFRMQRDNDMQPSQLPIRQEPRRERSIRLQRPRLRQEGDLNAQKTYFLTRHLLTSNVNRFESTHTTTSPKYWTAFQRVQARRSAATPSHPKAASSAICCTQSTIERTSRIAIRWATRSRERRTSSEGWTCRRSLRISSLRRREFHRSSGTDLRF